MFGRKIGSVNAAVAKFGCGVVILMAAGTARGAVIYAQPWDLEHDSFPSSIAYCTDQMSGDEWLWDDWMAQQDRTIRRVKWWGHLTSSDAQEFPGAKYCIKIAEQNPNVCVPGQIVYQADVRAKKQYVAGDCLTNSVYGFVARLPNGGFAQQAGVKYWISIAEINSESATQGVDFEWSSRLPRRRCPAVREHADGSITRPLFSNCDDEVVDLSFVLFGPP